MQIDFNIPVRGHYQNAAALPQAMRMPMYRNREAIMATRVTTTSPIPMTLQAAVHWILQVMIYHFKEGVRCSY